MFSLVSLPLYLVTVSTGEVLWVPGMAQGGDHLAYYGFAGGEESGGFR